MGNGSEILLACDMTFVSREKTLISQWEVGVGMVAGGGPMARLPLATRIGSFDKWAISNTKRLVNAASLPADVEMAAGWDACIASVKRPTTQARIKAFMDLGFHQPGDAENHIGQYLEGLNR